MEIIDIENDYFLICFSQMVDYNRVFMEGPWIISGHYLVIQKWRPEFFPFEDKMKRVAVWIRIPMLPVEYYDRHLLWRIGKKLGRVLKVDENTLKGWAKDGSRGPTRPERGKFARICIEVDLRKVLVAQFKIHR